VLYFDSSPFKDAIERFKRSYREEVLDANLFTTVIEANELSKQWKHHYNYEWPHQSLNYQIAAGYAAA